MHDHHFGHRHYKTGKPRVDRDKDEWIEWDYALVTALKVIDDFTDKHGLLVWETEADRIMVSAVRRTDKFQAAIDRLTGKKNYKPKPGEVFSPKIELRGGEYPTYQEYIEGLIKDGTIEG